MKDAIHLTNTTDNLMTHSSVVLNKMIKKNPMLKLKEMKWMNYY